MAETDDIADLVRPLVEALNLDLYDVERNGKVLAVLVDGPEGIDSDSLTSLSRQISVALDEADPISGNYTLEVSSPGVERRLRRPEQFTGALGEKVTIRTTPGADGRQRLIGVITEVDDFSLVINDEEQGPLSVSFSDIAKARTVFEWGPAPKPGGPKSAKASTSSSSRPQPGNKKGHAS
ncbi:MAG: ribosome maturation factor RimP [Candidatus Poriferisodalaceae bacterium]|jgi:ribosome maturation factor RimP